MHPPPSVSSFLFAIFFICVTATKTLHLSLNAHVFPTAIFIFCLPAFLVPDIILISTVWVLFRRKNTIISLLGFALGCLICLLALGVASSQLGFFYQTGGEIDWTDATKFALSEEGRKVLLSEGATPLSFACTIVVISWIVKLQIYNLVSGALATGEAHLRSAARWTAEKLGFDTSHKVETESFLLPTQEHHSDSDTDCDSDSDFGDVDNSGTDQGRTKSHARRAVQCLCFVQLGFILLVVLGLLSITTLFDPDRPYYRMLTTLPLPLFAIFASKPIECSSSSWPLPELIDKVRWENPRGNFKGWAPGTANDIVQKYRGRVPDWLPTRVPNGFSRWIQNATKDDGQVLLQKGTAAHGNGCPDPLVSEPYYNPANDPMKITNLDKAVLEPLQQVFKERSVKIKHIALILMESLREELFPLRQGSNFHDLIMESHDERQYDDINELLSYISPNTERITGLDGRWMSQNGTAFGPRHLEWNDKTKEGFGGINIKGALTTSSISTKSLATAHCGTWPIPVDMFEEADTESYQPCLPEILELFNRMKKNTTTDDFHEQQWYPAFFQAVTDDFDRQNKFDDKIGFKYIVNKNRIKQEAYKDPELEEISYFGFPDTALKTYITNYITSAISNKQRMFISHFTSTTHHPWAIPKWFNSSDYMGTVHGLMRNHEDLNRYLNTVRFNDAWIGQLLQIFDDKGISNETLVIFVGDHGQAFKEDFSKTGTYDNPHISNHRVPITFRHPQLPRIQHRVNATSLSILPTVLDLLVNTDSLNKKDAAAAADLVYDYEGQSLIRPFKTTHKGRRAWNYSLVNPGGRMLTITSSDTPWRLVLPLDKKTEYIFSDLGSDPLELKRVLQWSISSLASTVRHSYGDEAAEWLLEAEKVGLWWASERKRLWKYSPS